MYKIIEKKILSEDIFSMDILAPRIANSALPGQFVTLITDEKGERIPFTICDHDREKGTVKIVVQAVGCSTKELQRFEKGDSLYAFVGPLGRASDFVNQDIEELKRENIIFIAGGVGAAPVYPQVKWLKERGIESDVIIGAQSKDRVILEEELKKYAKNVYIATDDGSYGFHGFVTDYLRDLVENEKNEYTKAVAIGPTVMMKFTSLLTKELEIPTIVSMNPIMVDGTGMCGACRVTVGGETRFACVDGPEFDAHLVDFDEAIRRQGQYKEEEIQSDHEYCDLVGGIING